ncbi:MAG: hypothetical protein EBT38_04215, partial [Acidimicrobiia bacterium]|nr:hypothetical protein [Acidimicrobiia bacterium]
YDSGSSSRHADDAISGMEPFRADAPTHPAVGANHASSGGVDTIGRPTFQRLSQRLGQQVVIDNRAGNNGNIAMDHVTKKCAVPYQTLKNLMTFS